MSSQSSLALFDLPVEMKLAVFSQLTNTEVMRMAATCSYAKQFVDAHSRTLSSRPSFGDDFTVYAKEDSVTIWKKGAKRPLTKSFNQDSDFDGIRHVSINTLKIQISDKCKIPKLSEFLKKWNPICNTTKMDCSIEFNDVLPVAKTIRCVGSMEITAVLDLNKANELKEVPDHWNLNPQIETEVRSNDLFEQMKNFSGFNVRASDRTKYKFFKDLETTENAGKLKELSFTVPLTNYHGNTPYMPLNYPESTKQLYKCSYIDDFRLAPISFLKVSLLNNMCILIEEEFEGFAHMGVNCQIIKDDDDQILDILIEKLKINEDVYFPYEKRQRYLTNSWERAELLTTAHYSSNKEDYIEEEERIRRKNDW